jgi:prepilin-type N-terminal cleavage/methylation domain-containing protein
MKKSGFTMIELIFVIVIIAILAVVAIPKLAATRDDARIATIAQNTMTGAFEVASYAVSRGMTESTISAMSNGVKQLIDRGLATESGTDVTISSGDVADCLHLKIEDQGTDTEVVVVQFTGSGGNCDRLQSLIDENRFPIPLHGTLISI